MHMRLISKLRIRFFRALKQLSDRKGKLPVVRIRTVRRLLLAILAMAVVCLIIGYAPAQGRYWPLAAVLGLLFAYGIIHVTLLRCPRCHEWLGREHRPTCRRCGCPLE